MSCEEDLDKATILAQGVDYIKEVSHIEHITEAAIGKVMIMLAYDYNFTGHVQIFTDNLTAMEKWAEVPTNSRLALLFESVTVSYIPREKNKRADRLGRTKMFISISPEIYAEITNKVSAYDSIQRVVVKQR